jgi:hypothetical protein
MKPGVGKSPPFRDTPGRVGHAIRPPAKRFTVTGGKRFVVRADEKLTAFLELESAIRAPEKILEGWSGS